jgi:hypothetical protein
MEASRVETLPVGGGLCRLGCGLIPPVEGGVEGVGTLEEMGSMTPGYT